MSALIVQELRVLILSNRCLHLVDGLLDEHTILHIEDSIRIAL